MTSIVLAPDLESLVEDPFGETVDVDVPIVIEAISAPEIDVDVLVPQPSEIAMEPAATDVLVLPVVGPEGPAGASVLEIFEYQMPVAQTTAYVDHDLGRNPVAVQVFVDGVEASEYEVVFTVPAQQVRVAFDVAVAALIRLF